MLNHNGGMIDDLILYALSENEFFLVVNASNVDKDYAWIEQQAASFNVTVKNESDMWSQIAVQGPTTLEVIEAIVSADDLSKVKNLKYMDITPVTVDGQPSLIGRTGYTGEFGFEVYLPHKAAPFAWTAMLETSHKTGVRPIGLGARDTLRLESCYLLYGNDMNESVTPLEAGISWAVKLNGEDFIGKSKLVAQQQAGLKVKTVCFKMEEPGIARHDMKVYWNGAEAGIVTSGSLLPTLDFAGGMMRIEAAAAAVGNTVEIDIRGKRKLAKIVKKPLYIARVK
jgi:aminomethyltransferase